MIDKGISFHLDTIKNEADIFKKAKALRDSIKTHQLRVMDVAQALGIKPSYLCHILRLNKLPDLIVDGYYAQLITLSHLFVISRLKTKEDMVSIYEKILSENKTVIETEEIVRDILYGVQSDGTYLTEQEVRNLTNEITKKHKRISIKVVQTRIKGKCTIEIKGSVSKTGDLLKNLLKNLESWQEDKGS